jgi:hypothetical protein
MKVSLTFNAEATHLLELHTTGGKYLDLDPAMFNSSRTV